jgi:hypothetical protein
LGTLLQRYAVEDVSVHERPLEEVIAEVFQETRKSQAPSAEAGDPRGALR